MKKLLPFFAVLLLLVGSVLGQMPNPVAGQVKLSGYPYPEGLTVEQTNARTGITYDSIVDANGFFVMDWGNNPFIPGDKVEVAVKVCKERPECRKVITLNMGTPVLVNFDVPVTSEIIIKIEEIVRYKFVCSDGSVKDSKDDCPLVVAPEPVVKEIVREKDVIRCSDGSLALSVDSCPRDPLTVKLAAVSALLAGVLLVLVGAYALNRKKYKWIPGMTKILKVQLRSAEKLNEEGDKEGALRKLNTLEKTANTLVKKVVSDKKDEVRK